MGIENDPDAVSTTPRVPPQEPEGGTPVGTPPPIDQAIDETTQDSELPVADITAPSVAVNEADDNVEVVREDSRAPRSPIPYYPVVSGCRSVSDCGG